jgi:HEAT repeat protein
LVTILMVAGLVLIPSLAPLAQRVKESESPITVTGVGARESAGSTVVTVSADAPLNRTQTWQEGDKFHLVVPYAGSGTLRNLPRGVRVNRVSNSLEIVVNLKSGASVTVDPRFNHLNLIVNGGLNTAQQNEAKEATAAPSVVRAQQRAAAASDNAEPSSPRAMRERAAPQDSNVTLPFMPGRSTQPGSKPLPSTNPSAQSPAPGTAPASQPPPANAAAPTQIVPAQDDKLVADNSVSLNDPAAQSQFKTRTTEGSSFFSMVFSTTGVAILISMSLLALAYLRLRPVSTETDEDGADKKAEASEKTKDEGQVVALATSATAAPAVVKTEQRQGQRRKSLRRKNDRLAAAGSAAVAPEAELALDAHAPSQAGPAALFGAYRVDQEVGKLVLGQPHRMDVLASRAPDDRRAIETSLLKSMNGAETDDEGRRRARQALEEYGFLARHSAALLLAHQACDRAAAARMLGQIGAPAALPFLLEALYDTEMIVRAQVVSSIGSLKLPSAIGALLDMARRHPEMPSAPLSQALSACSVDCLDIGGVFEPERPLLFSGTDGFDGEIASLEPSGAYEQLPEFLEDESLSEALERLGNTDVEVRAAAARRLAQFQTQASVAALTALATRDTEVAVRAAAVSSLGEIDHESVFAPVLMAFADEAREVQAAAARALSRLNFNRADAYVRIIEKADEEALVGVARACIKARMAAQAIDRLGSDDRRQAYEAFSMLSLLAKANETGPILEAIAVHPDQNIRMAAIRLLGMTGRAEVAQQFRQLAVRDGMPEKVRTSLLEVVYKIDQALPV